MNFLKITSFIFLFCLTTSCAAQSSSQIQTNKTEAQSSPKTKMTDKPKIENIDAIFVSLEIEGKNSLFVLLAKDGSINRLGTGTEDNTENDMFIGVTSSEAFEKLHKKIEPEIFNWEGEYKAPNIAGKTCKLTVGFRIADGRETGSVWEYGTKSQGPPPEIGRLVVASVGATEAWFEEQKRVTKKKP